MNGRSDRDPEGSLADPTTEVTTARGRGGVVAVVGGGPAGMVAALRLAERLPGASIVLLEGQDRLGGKIRTERTAGFVLEGGPEALVAAKPAAAALLRDLGLAGRMAAPTAANAGTAVRVGDRLRPLPEGLTGFLPRRFLPIVRTPLVSPRGKLRMALEPLLPARHTAAEADAASDADADETVAAFFSRRIGREGYEALVAPLVESIWSGDGDRLSLAAAFPQLRDAERMHGSLFRAALAANRVGAASDPAGGAAGGSAGAPPSGPTGAVASGPAGAAPSGPPLAAPAGGMGELVEALDARLRASGVRIERGAAVGAVEPDGAGWLVRMTDGEALRADGVVLAIPAHAASALVTGFDPALAAGLAAIPHASTATVALAFREDELPPLRGHGYVSRREPGVPATAATWVWRKWVGRVPAGFALVRVSLGNLDRTALDAAPDEHLAWLARSELRRVAGIAAEPVLTRVVRWPEATPLATVGHLDRVAAIDGRRRLHPALALASAGLAGSGLADAIAAGDRAADQIAAALAEPTSGPASAPPRPAALGVQDIRRPNAPDGSWGVAFAAPSTPARSWPGAAPDVAMDHAGPGMAATSASAGTGNGRRPPSVQPEGETTGVAADGVVTARRSEAAVGPTASA